MAFVSIGIKVGTSAAAALLCITLAQAQPSARPSASNELMRKDLVSSMASKEVVMSTVEYAPGGSSPPHRHDAQVFVYVVAGHVTMQVKDGPLQTLGPGDTFYESPTDVHVVSANASKTEPAKFLAILIKDKGQPASHPVAPAP